ncbi:MAG TPA: 4Fe-4S binding protein, partial [Myxococcota bacterium]
MTAGVERLAFEMGADLVGVADAATFEGAPEGHRPQNLLRRARSVVVVAVHLLDGAFELAPSREYSITFQMASLELDRIAFHVARYLEGQGYRAVQVPASPPYDLENNMGDLSHRHAGQLAGIGVLGKNSLLLSPEFGPRMRLTSVVTDAALEPSAPLDVDLCQDCDICLHACPVDALEGPGIV